MRLILLLFVFALSVSTTNAVTLADSTKLEGRWDLTILVDGKENPSWLEVTHSGHKTLVGHFVGISGS